MSSADINIAMVACFKRHETGFIGVKRVHEEKQGGEERCKQTKV